MKRLIAFVLGLGIVFPPSSIAHDLEAPEAVEANQDGTFEFEWTFSAGPGSALFAGAGWNGLVNVSGGEHGDCFCLPEICLIEEGKTTHFSIHGTLEDPAQAGSVMSWVALCDGPDLQVLTAILPYGTTPAVSHTWSFIKALYKSPR